LGAPLAPVVAVSGNGVGAAGKADAVADNEASADAGASRSYRSGTPMWAATSGDDGTMAGNVVQPALAGPVSTDDNAVGGAGNADVDGSSTYTATAGGTSRTAGQDAVLSGNFADAPVALPVSGAGNSTSGVGNTAARHANDSTTRAGGDTYTNGDRSVLSANSANLPPAGAADLCGNGTTAGGIAQGECENEVTSTSGGYNGTTGNDAVLSGNIGQAPIGVPAEAFSNSVGAAGTPSGRMTERKTITSGRAANSIDDNGTASSNVVSTPTAIGGQVFGNSGGAVANPTSRTDSDTTIDVGNPPRANGKAGSASGNIVHVPTSNPGQVFGQSVVGVGNGSSDTTTSMDSRSGGTAVTEGDDGSLSGNVLTAPQSSSPQLYGSAVGAGSNVESQSRNEVGSRAGGDVFTSGDRGSFAGNGVAAQSVVPMQVFGDAATAGGTSEARSSGATDLVAGGRHLTSGEDSAWSGNLLTAPVGVEPAAHGDAVSAAGLATAQSVSRAESRAGGTTGTFGKGPGSVRDADLPTSAFARLVGVPIELLGTATAGADDRSRMRTGETTRSSSSADQVKGIDLPVGVDSLLGITQVPSLVALRGLLPQATSLDELRGVPIHGLPQHVARTVGLTRYAVSQAQLADVQAADADLPIAGLPTAGLPTAGLPVAGLPAAELPTAQLPRAEQPTAELPVTTLPVSELPTTVLPRTGLPMKGRPGVTAADLPVQATSPLVGLPTISGKLPYAADKVTRGVAGDPRFAGVLPTVVNKVGNGLGVGSVTRNVPAVPTAAPRRLVPAAPARGRTLPTAPI
ncbi:hypothetical protein, partial [Saccharothrix hoggarensis]